MNEEQLKDLGKGLVEYCKKYSIPLQYFFEILNDQKVNPMMRGKGMEYNIFLYLQSSLEPGEWGVEKLNLNPQPNMPDVDIGVTHRRTGERLKVEAKPSVRGSMSSGTRSKVHKVPHFKVKCHRSRSSMKKPMNDRYEVDTFDIIITNPSNAILKGRTFGPELEIIQDKKVLKTLYEYYKVDNESSLIQAVDDDWRFVVSSDIAIEGYLPRTPYVLLKDDPNWLQIGRIGEIMLDIVIKRKARPKR